jgi:capsid protein
MGYLSKLWSRRAPRGRGAAFPAADIGRLTSSWTQDPGAINRWLRYELRTLRARARQLARGDAYGARFIRACVDNIAGPDPFASSRR